MVPFSQALLRGSSPSPTRSRGSEDEQGEGQGEDQQPQQQQLTGSAAAAPNHQAAESPKQVRFSPEVEEQSPHRHGGAIDSLTPDSAMRTASSISTSISVSNSASPALWGNQVMPPRDSRDSLSPAPTLDEFRSQIREAERALEEEEARIRGYSSSQERQLEELQAAATNDAEEAYRLEKLREVSARSSRP